MASTGVGADWQQVMTVRGPVDPAQLGFTLTHEHFLLNTHQVTGNGAALLNDRELALQEVDRFKRAGGRTVIDLTNRGLIPSPAAIPWLAEETGLHIVMGCGSYRERFYHPQLRTQTTGSLAAELVREIEEGFADTRVRPGIIGEIGTDGAFVSPAEERVFRAAARAHQRTDLAIVTHALDSAVGPAQIDLLEEEGVDLRRVAIAHCATYPDPDYHAAIARRGSDVQFNVRGRYPYETERELRLIEEFLHRGYVRLLLLAQDVCLRSHLLAYGGKGYAYLISEFVTVLMQPGLTCEEVDTIFVENPRRLLVGG